MFSTGPRKTSSMKFILRLLLSLPLMALVAFCLFGFFATFEPMSALHQWIWRGVYSIAGLAALAVIGWMWLRSSPFWHS